MDARFDIEKKYARQYSVSDIPGNFLDQELIKENVDVILLEMEWLERVLDQRIKELNDPASLPLDFAQAMPPDHSLSQGPYADLIRKYNLDGKDRLLLVCSLLPHFAPGLLTAKLKAEHQNHLGVRFPELGGYIDGTFFYFIPTVKTMLFLMAGNDLNLSTIYHLELQGSILFREQIIRLKPVSSSEDDTNRLNLTPAIAAEYVYYLQSGITPRPDFGKDFPATLLTTSLEWDDLVLTGNTMKQVQDVMEWVQHSNELLSLGKGMINHSFPCLFYGPPGTGKTLTVKLIGKQYKKEVFRIDLSMVVSKYIGETEKNLAQLFDRADGKDWILFFDEADSLFSTRTSVSNSNDKWANLEVSYLLQRMEDHKGLTILATNLRNNLDSALTRRFQAIIHFPLPSQQERQLIWQKALPPYFSYPSNINIQKLASYELSGANIANIIKWVCLKAVSKNSNVIMEADLVEGMKREYAKESRTM